MSFLTRPFYFGARFNIAIALFDRAKAKSVEGEIPISDLGQRRLRIEDATRWLTGLGGFILLLLGAATRTPVLAVVGFAVILVCVAVTLWCFSGDWDGHELTLRGVHPNFVAAYEQAHPPAVPSRQGSPPPLR